MLGSQSCIAHSICLQMLCLEATASVVYLHEVGTVGWQVDSPEGGTQPSVPHKLPAGLINWTAAGERP